MDESVRKLQDHYIDLLQEVNRLQAANNALERRVSQIKGTGTVISQRPTLSVQVPIPINPPNEQPGPSTQTNQPRTDVPESEQLPAIEESNQQMTPPPPPPTITPSESGKKAAKRKQTEETDSESGKPSKGVEQRLQ